MGYPAEEDWSQCSLAFSENHVSLQSFSEVLENEPEKDTMNPDSLLNESNAYSESDDSSSGGLSAVL
jgi:hypothetical protein